ncbi:MAG: hypothetical protein HY360_03435 [Verrucomicrobia bacterium]|nr:hypothetical protein [Verrucomicrobiota bacterium]
MSRRRRGGGGRQRIRPLSTAERDARRIARLEGPALAGPASRKKTEMQICNQGRYGLVLTATAG